MNSNSLVCTDWGLLTDKEVMGKQVPTMSSDMECLSIPRIGPTKVSRTSFISEHILVKYERRNP